MIPVEGLAVARSPFGAGEVLLTEATAAGEPVTCVAPVGVRVRADEPSDMLEGWRCAMWADADAMLAGAAPERLAALSLVDLVAFLPEEHHEWVRQQIDGQLRAIAAFGAAGDDASNAGYRREAERAELQLRRELREAFPGESWDRAGERELAGAA